MVADQLNLQTNMESHSIHLNITYTDTKLKPKSSFVHSDLSMCTLLKM